MSDPRRWLDSDDLDPEVHALLDAAQAPRAMTSAERVRTQRRIAHIAVIPVAAGLIMSLKTVAYAAVIGSLAGAALGGAVHLWRSAPDAAPATPVMPKIIASTPPAPERAVLPPAPAPPEPSAESPASAEPSAAPSDRPPTDTLEEEAALLEEARSAMAGSPSRALGLLGQHATRYPRGKLAIERELLTIDALHQAGRHAEARARARALLARAPGSLYEKRLRRALE